MKQLSKSLGFLRLVIEYLHQILGFSSLVGKMGSILPVKSKNLRFAQTKIAILALVLFMVSTSFSFAVEVDLALSQSVSNSNPSMGSQVKYTVSLTNQGNTTATNIEIEDVVPKEALSTISGLASVGTWSYNGATGVGSWKVVSLAPNQTVILEISGTVMERGVYFNVAQIKSGAEEDIDSMPNNSKLNEDDIATSCFSVPLQWSLGDEYTVEVPAPYSYGSGIKWFRNGVQITPGNIDAMVNTNNSLTIKNPGSYTFTTNLASCPATGCCAVLVEQGPIFDLALRKTSVSTSVVAGGQVTFKLEVFNQGNLTARNIELVDYIPAGLVLADADWNLVGSTAVLKVPITSLAANTSTSVEITFNVSPTVTGQIKNYGEISSAKGPNGENITDKDSTPDGNPTNDGTPKDDEINENGKTNGDEDDHDVSTISVTPAPIFDLALVKKMAAGTGALYPGSLVTFNISVLNQGTVLATDVKLVDYIPAGLELADANWIQSGNTATNKNAIASIAAGSESTVSITFKISSTFTGTSITNNSEISSVKGPNGEVLSDLDSTPDANPNNDGLAKDDVVNENGNTGGDEDDSDFAVIEVKQLASLGNFVWLDVDQDGVQDTGEPGISGVSVTLQKPDGTIVATTTTGGDGKYLFSNLTPGDYVVVFGKPSGYSSSPFNAGSDDTLDSDANPTTGKTGTYTLAAGEHNPTVDAGFFLGACPAINTIAASNEEICVGDSTYLSAVASNNSSIDWYLIPSGGTKFKTTTSGQKYLVYPTTTTVYYAQLVTTSIDCPVSRTPVVVVVNARPSNPSCGSIIEVCGGDKANLSTHIINGITTPGGVFEWHVSASPSSALVTNPSAVGPGIYYLFEKSGAGCYSNPTIANVVLKACDKLIDLSLLKTANKRVVAVNENITYTIAVTNAGPDVATNVKIEDRLPSGLNFVSSSTLVADGAILKATIPSIAVGQTISFTYIASASAGGNLINVAEVVAADQKDKDSTPGNANSINEDDDDDEVITVDVPNPLADLSVQKLVSTSTPNLGDNVTYTVRVSNAGPFNATNVEVTDAIPAGLSLVAASGADQIVLGTNSVTAKFNTILVNEELEFKVIAKVTGTGAITNRAEVTKVDQKDPDSTPNSGSNEDDDDISTIVVGQPCNPTAPLISCANPYICGGESVSISAIGCNGTVVWSNGMTGNVITVSPSVNTSYTAKCKVGECLSANSNILNIIVNTLLPPSVVATSNSICVGGSTILTASGCSGIITWSNGVLGSSIQVSPSVTTTYTATCKVLSCMSGNSNPVTITIGNNASAPVISASNMNLCLGESSTLSATGCTGTITWSNGLTGSSIVIAPTSTSTFTAKCSLGTCMSPASNSLVVNVGSKPAISIISSTDASCGNEPVTLTVNGCPSGVLWSTGATTASVTVTPSTTSVYSVTCGTGTCASSANKTIVVGGLGQTPTITLSKPSICEGESVVLTASNCSGTITWSQGSSTVAIGSGATLTVSPAETTVYKATCGSGTACAGFATSTLTVTAKPAAPIVTCGSERICAGESLVFTAHNCDGIVTWSTGVMGATMTVNPLVSTSYSATCTVNGCVGASSAPVLIQVITQTPVITASANSVCPGQSVTLTASNCTGSLSWSTGATSVSITVSPSIATEYTLTCTVENCRGVAKKTINTGGTGETPIVTASKTSICEGESVTLTASNCSGMVTWTKGTSTAVVGTGLSLMDAPALTSVYTAVCTSTTGCTGSATAVVNVISKSSAPTIAANNANICIGQSATLVATNCAGTVTWSTGVTAASLTVSPTSNTSYTATCAAGSCVSAVSNAVLIKVNTTPVPTITASATSICAGQNVTLTASNCAGTITWSTGATTVAITVSPIAATEYTLSCSIEGCVGTAKQTITTGGAGQTPTVVASKTGFCEGESVTLTASNCSGAITWTKGGSSTSVGTGLTLMDTPVANTTYTATCVGSAGCSGAASVAVTVTPKPSAPTIAANNANICIGQSATLVATNCAGTVTWSTGATGSTLNVSPVVSTSYTATCAVNGCVSLASTPANVVVTSTVNPIITASKETICSGDAVTLTASNCAGTISWSTGATSVAISVNPVANTQYTLTCSIEGCNGSVNKTITVGSGQLPIITTTKSNVCSGEAVTLTASNCTSTLTWSSGQTAASITVNPTATTTYTATCGSGTCGGSASSTITVSPMAAPVITAPNAELCVAGTVVFTATGCTGTVTWSNGQTGNTMTLNATSTHSISATCSAGSCVSASSNTINVNVGSPTAPVITSTGTSVCNGSSISLTASGCSGTVLWSNGMTGNTISVTPSVSTNYTAICRLSNNNCDSPASNLIRINTVDSPSAPVITCSADRICPGAELTLTAIGCQGTVTWFYDNKTATGSTLLIKPSVTTAYTATCSIGTCTSASSGAATITVGNPIPPVVTCNSTLICSGTSTTIQAAGCVGTVKWSNGMEGAVISVSPTTQTTYTAVCKGGTCESTTSNAITVVVSGTGLASPVVKDLANVCPNLTVDLSTAVTSSTGAGNSFVFRTGNTPGSPAVTNAGAITSSGVYYVFATSGNECFSSASKINVSINTCTQPLNCTTSPATASAGANQTVCLSDNFITLNGTIGGAASSATWSSNGTGTFENSLSLNTKYYYSPQDIANGTVTVTLTTNDPDNGGACVAAVSSKVITINAVKTLPTISTSKSPIICLGDSVTLTANPDASAYIWSNGATTKSIVVKTPGAYSVKFKDASGCTSLSSTTVGVNVNSAVAAPTVLASTKNVCPVTTVNLASAVTSQVATGGMFEFKTGSSPSSAILSNVNAVGTGTYYVFEKSATGCYSNASKISVSIDNCNVLQSDADIQVAIVGNKSSIVIGDQVTYTITVKNNGPANATKVKISNAIPTGIEIVGATTGLTKEGSNLTAEIATLALNESKVYTYIGKITTAGIISNVVTKLSADQNDPIVSNNTSKFDVECNTCQATCVATALKADTIRQANGSYNVKFTAVINNCGNVELTGVQLTEDLKTMFTSPAQYTVVQKPTPSKNSTLVGNDNYNGSTDLNVLTSLTSKLAPGKTDTVVFVVNLVPNGAEGPFSTNSKVKGVGLATIVGTTIPQEVSDTSNNGIVVDKPSSEPTVIKLFKSPSIALAMSVKDTVRNANGSYNVRYRIIVKNNGALALNSVVLTDTLSKYFKSPASFTVVGTPVVNTGSQLVVNAAFNGTSDVRLTLPASKLAIAKVDTVCFTMNLVPGTVKEFANQSVGTATGTLTNNTTQTVTDLSNSGTNPDLSGSTPTQLILGGNGETSVINTCVGVALSVVKKDLQSDNSYNVTYQAIVKNCGNLNLANVSICDTLQTTFPSPVTYTVIGVPTVGVGSTLVPNTGFNGTTNQCLLTVNSSSLAPGKVDTVRWTLNVKPGTNNGPFTNNVKLTSTSPSGLVVTDLSNDGINPAPEGSVPTVINFGLPKELIGLAKNLVKVTKVSGVDNMYDVEFKFVIKNYGSVEFNKVQLVDNLAQTFGDKVIIDSVAIKDIETGLKASTTYTGKGTLTNMLVDSTSKLPVNASRSLGLLVRVDLTSADTLKYTNLALVKGTYAGGVKDDASVAGLNPDKNNDGNPNNDSDPTVIDFTGLHTLVPVTPLGIAKAVTDTVRSADGSYLVSYSVIVKNYGTVKLDSVQLVEDLATVFTSNTQFTLIGSPTLNASSKLKLNTAFDGKAIKNMLISGQSSILPSVSDTLRFKVKVANNGTAKQTYKNVILGSALSGTKVVTDKSTNGMNPDKNLDKNPGNDSETTDVILSPSKSDTTAVKVWITNGLTPGSAVNNVFVVKDAANLDPTVKTTFAVSDNIEVMIYNRWGHLVYRSDNYVRDMEANKGWDGTSNQGVRLESDKYVADGTYYYVVTSTNTRLFGGKPAINFITVKR
jgi:large repetitive protein